jgi:hypothetical protein
MSTAKDLASTFSFIGPFMSDPLLASYGNNALPVFAVALHMGVEDIASFAMESLTDHSQDKKADIIYIDEADGIACIAQGYCAQDWGKQEAPANKACDLNTAAAWLLQRPINEIPDVIRPNAKLLREGLEKKTINKLIFAYAHNAYESLNVQTELETVKNMVGGLNLLKESGAEIEVVELGLRQIEALYLNSQGSIQVVEELEFSTKAVIQESGSGWRAYGLSLNGEILYDMYEKHKNALFSANLRDFLGARKVPRNVNNRIRETVEKSPGHFFILNNGITLVTKKAEFDEQKGILRVHGVSVVNGAQTTGAIHAAGRDNAKNVSALARFITVDNPAMISMIVTGNNTQNSIVAWDRRSNDPTQIRIKEEFKAKGVDYVHRRDSTRKAATSLFADQVGQMLCAFKGDLQTAIRAKADIFESDATYGVIFPATLSIGHVFAVQTLGWAYDQIKRELKVKSEANSITDIEKRQLSLLDYPASKQFLMTVLGNLREEIVGAKLASPVALELKMDVITGEGKEAVAAWLKVLRSVLPVMVQNLPAEEYQVVRSTEHTETVAKATKGVIAGIDLFKSSFEDLRKILKPVN